MRSKGSSSDGARRSWRDPVIRARRIEGMIRAFDDPLYLACRRSQDDPPDRNAYMREYRRGEKSQAYTKAYRQEHRERANALRRIRRAKARAARLVAQNLQLQEHPSGDGLGCRR